MTDFLSNTIPEEFTSIREIEQSLSNVDLYQFRLAEVIILRERVLTLTNADNITLDREKLAQVNQIFFKINLVIATMQGQLTQFLREFFNKCEEHKAATAENLMNIVNAIKNSRNMDNFGGNDLKAAYILIASYWGTIISPREMMKLVKSCAHFYDDRGSESENAFLAKEIVENEGIEDGTLRVACSGGRFRSAGLVKEIKNNNGATLLVAEKSYIPIYDLLTRFQTISEEGITLVLFSGENGRDLETFINSMMNLLVHKAIPSVDPSVILNLIMGDLGPLGIKQFIIAQREAKQHPTD